MKVCIIANKVNNTKSLIADIKTVDAIELHIVELDKTETCPEEKELAKDGLHR